MERAANRKVSWVVECVRVCRTRTQGPRTHDNNGRDTVGCDDGLRDVDSVGQRIKVKVHGVALDCIHDGANRASSPRHVVDLAGESGGCHS
jgi:hypothetical protein